MRVGQEYNPYTLLSVIDRISASTSIGVMDLKTEDPAFFCLGKKLKKCFRDGVCYYGNPSSRSTEIFNSLLKVTQHFFRLIVLSINNSTKNSRFFLQCELRPTEPARESFITRSFNNCIIKSHY